MTVRADAAEGRGVGGPGAGSSEDEEEGALEHHHRLYCEGDSVVWVSGERRLASDAEEL